VWGKRGVTAETAWLLAQALSTTPEFWVNLQSAYDLARFRPAQAVERLVAKGWRLVWPAATMMTSRR
jgi:plasmid maintenance system antidote protein VapI